MRVIGLSAALAACLLAASPATAHDWYPEECCSASDCQPRPCDLLQQLTDGGIRDLETRARYRRDQVRPSKDGRCHICTGGGFLWGPPICVFTNLDS